VYVKKLRVRNAASMASKIIGCLENQKAAFTPEPQVKSQQNQLGIYNTKKKIFNQCGDTHKLVLWHQNTWFCNYDGP